MGKDTDCIPHSRIGSKSFDGRSGSNVSTERFGSKETDFSSFGTLSCHSRISSIGALSCHSRIGSKTTNEQSFSKSAQQRFGSKEISRGNSKQPTCARPIPPGHVPAWLNELFGTELAHYGGTELLNCRCNACMESSSLSWIHWKSRGGSKRSTSKANTLAGESTRTPSKMSVVSGVQDSFRMASKSRIGSKCRMASKGSSSRGASKTSIAATGNQVQLSGVLTSSLLQRRRFTLIG